MIEALLPAKRSGKLAEFAFGGSRRRRKSFASAARPRHKHTASCFAPPQQIDALDAAVAEIDREGNDSLEPFRTSVNSEHYSRISQLSAAVITARSHRHSAPTEGLSSLGLPLPKNDESAESGGPPACARRPWSKPC